jgi:branched-chain amino acid transport system permease protein
MALPSSRPGLLARLDTPIVVIAVALLVVVASPFVSTQYLARIDLLLIAIISAAALNLLTGLAGQVSLGHAAFMAVGAYTAVALQRAGVNELLVTLPVGAIVAGIVGFLVGIPSLRFRGFYLALTTLALHFAVTFFALKYQTAAGSTAGFTLPAPTLASFTISGQERWCVLLAVLCTCVLLVFHNFTRTKVGRAWVAIRDRDLAASIIGVHVVRYKLLAFVASSSVAGFAGVLQGYLLGNVSSETFALSVAISMIAMIIIGGMGSVVVGSVLGAVVVTQLPFIIQGVADLIMGQEAGTSFAIFDIQSGVFGLVIVGFLLFEPGGLVGIARRLLEKRGTSSPQEV